MGQPDWRIIAATIQDSKSPKYMASFYASISSKITLGTGESDSP
jgi:hypothetical protein